MAFLNIKDTRLSTWLKKYNAKEKKAVDEANKVIAAQAKALKKKNLPKGLVDVSTGKLATSKIKYAPINLPSEYLPLKVVQSSGVEVTPRVNINVTDLNKKGSVLYKHFYNNTGHNDITFKVDVIIKRNERWKCALYTMYKGKSINDIKSWAVTTVLKEWIRNSVPLYIVSSAIDIPDGNYVITGNPTRKQTYNVTTINLHSNLVLKNGCLISKSDVVLNADHQKNIRIENVEIDGSRQSRVAIYMNYVTSAKIVGCKIHNLYSATGGTYAVQLKRCSSSTISKSEIFDVEAVPNGKGGDEPGSSRGIVLQACSNVKVEWNHVYRIISSF